MADHALSKAKTPEENRMATLLALAPIYDFLKSVGVQSRALRGLSMDLQNIERGQSPELFQPSRPSAKRSGERVHLEGAAAAAVQLLMNSGKTKKEAAAIVATRLDLAGYRLSGSKPDPPQEQ